MVSYLIAYTGANRCSPIPSSHMRPPPAPLVDDRDAPPFVGASHACGWPERFCVCPLQRAHVHHTLGHATGRDSGSHQLALEGLALVESDPCTATI